MHRLELPHPISTNRYWRIFRGMAVKSSEARAYRADVAMEAILQGVCEPLQGAIHVEMTYHPKRPKKYKGGPVRAFDLDNCLKVCLDSLNGIAWIDDAQITHLAITRGEPVTDGALVVIWRHDQPPTH